ncbi:unnamed protein product, partial [Rotaria sordida]
PIVRLCINYLGTLLCSLCGYQTLKIFDILVLDMITMVKLDFIPLCSSFVYSSHQSLVTLVISDNDLFYSLINLQFDYSQTFLFYSIFYGIKILNLRTNSVRHFFGTIENTRFIHLTLYQFHKSSATTTTTTTTTISSDQFNSTILFTTAYKKN